MATQRIPCAKVVGKMVTVLLAAQALAPQTAPGSAPCQPPLLQHGRAATPQAALSRGSRNGAFMTWTHPIHARNQRRRRQRPTVLPSRTNHKPTRGLPAVSVPLHASATPRVNALVPQCSCAGALSCWSTSTYSYHSRHASMLLSRACVYWHGHMGLWLLGRV